MSSTFTLSNGYDFKDAKYDLDSLFTYGLKDPAPFDLPAELTLHACVMGENDEANWYWIFEHDGKTYYAEGGCDYTGWDCQSWGEVVEVESIDAALAKAPEKESRWGNFRPIRAFLRKQIAGELQLGVVSYEAL